MVIAIVIMLTGLLMPAVQDAFKQGRTVACKSNVGQVFSLLAIYASDHHGYMLQGDGGGIRPSDTNTYVYNYYWTFSLLEEGYLDDSKKADVHCPNMPLGGTYSVIVAYSDEKYRLPGESEWYPYGRFHKNAFMKKVLAPGGIPDPFNYAYITDGVTQSGSTRPLIPNEKFTHGGRAWHSFRWYNSGGQRQGVWLSHQGRANVGFLDGHVESCGPERLLQVANYNHQLPNLHGIDGWWTENGEVFMVVEP